MALAENRLSVTLNGSCGNRLPAKKGLEECFDFFEGWPQLEQGVKKSKRIYIYINKSSRKNIASICTVAKWAHL